MRSIYQIYNTLNVRHRKTENRFIWKQRKLSLFPFLCLADLSRDYRFSQSRATAATLHPPLLIGVRQKRCLLNTFVTNLNFNPEGVSAVLQRAGGWLLKKTSAPQSSPFFIRRGIISANLTRHNLNLPVQAWSITHSRVPWTWARYYDLFFCSIQLCLIFHNTLQCLYVAYLFISQTSNK